MFWVFIIFLIELLDVITEYRFSDLNAFRINLGNLMEHGHNSSCSFLFRPLACYIFVYVSLIRLSLRKGCRVIIPSFWSPYVTYYVLYHTCFSYFLIYFYPTVSILWCFLFRRIFICAVLFVRILFALFFPPHVIIDLKHVLYTLTFASVAHVFVKNMSFNDTAINSVLFCQLVSHFFCEVFITFSLLG